MSNIRQIEGKKAEDYEDALNTLFSKVQAPDSLPVELPSKGKFYKEFGDITVQPLTFADEERILRSGGKGGDVISMILDTCIEGIQIQDLIAMDKLYLLLKVREASYGPLYSFSIGCPNCQAEIKTEIDIIDGLRVKTVDDDMEDPRTVTLPNLGVEAKVKFPRVREDGFLKDSETALKNLYRFVVSLNDETDPIFISKALKRMHIMDVKTIVKAVHKGEFGVDSRFMFECPSCDNSTLMEMPLDAGFFSVT